MKPATASVPIMPAVSPAAMESAPSEGPTVRSSTIVSLVGSAPERSWTARLFAVSTEKLPEIWPEPPRMGSRMTGAERTLLSRTMAKGAPTLSFVNRPNLRAPDWLKRKEMMGSFVRESKPGCASTRSSPETTGDSCNR